MYKICLKASSLQKIKIQIMEIDMIIGFTDTIVSQYFDQIKLKLNRFLTDLFTELTILNNQQKSTL